MVQLISFTLLATVSAAVSKRSLRGASTYSNATIPPETEDAPLFLTNPTRATAASIMADLNSSSLGEYPHEHVHDALIDALNDPSQIPHLADLFARENASYCDPFPHCVYGQEAIQHYLTRLSSSLVDSYIIPQRLETKDKFRIGNGGGFWAPSMVISVKQSEQANTAWQEKYNTTANKTCIVGSPQFMQWFFAPNSSKLLQLRIFYDEATRHTQSVECLGSSKPEDMTLMLGHGNEDPVKRVALGGLYEQLFEVNSLPVLSSSNVEQWQSLFSDRPDDQDKLELCAFYPYCFYGDDAMPSFWSWQDTDGEMEKLFFVGGGAQSSVMVSGNVGSAMTSFTNTDNGCLESHLQFMVFTLAENSDKAVALSIFAAPPAVSMKLHDCHKE